MEISEDLGSVDLDKTIWRTRASHFSQRQWAGGMISLIDERIMFLGTRKVRLNSKHILMSISKHI